jgi:GTP:adenosylcobinamide-phosphate guanylyltransferase
MNQEKEDEKKDKNEEVNRVGTRLKNFIPNESYFKSIREAMRRGQLLSDSMKYAIESIDTSYLKSMAESVRMLDESIIITMKIMADSIKIPIVSPGIIRTLQELSESQRSTTRIIKNITSVCNAGKFEAYKGIINTGLSGTMRAQNAYIEAIERELKDARAGSSLK